MVDIRHLQVKQRVDFLLKRKKSFDDILIDEEILPYWTDFMNSKIGAIWLKKPNGQMFQQWMKENT